MNRHIHPFEVNGTIEETDVSRMYRFCRDAALENSDSRLGLRTENIPTCTQYLTLMKEFCTQLCNMASDWA